MAWYVCHRWSGVASRTLDRGVEGINTNFEVCALLWSQRGCDKKSTGLHTHRVRSCGTVRKLYTYVVQY